MPWDRDVTGDKAGVSHDGGEACNMVGVGDMILQPECEMVSVFAHAASGYQ